MSAVGGVRPSVAPSVEQRWTFRMTRARVVLIALTAVGGAAVAYRLWYGLGAATNLSDRWPWGMWVWWDVMTGVALAGGGYSTALLVNFLGREKWRDVERAALLTSLLGYLMVMVGLLLDLGRWFNVWRVPLIWTQNPHSVMFELVWCVSGYTFVQIVEFGHIVVERVPLPRLARLLHRIYMPTLFVGVMLPLMHQSALGSLYVIAKGRLDPLWWTMLLPVFFLCSSFFVGPAMVTVESFLSGKAHHRRPPMRILTEMVRLSGIVMAVYFVAKVADILARGQARHLFDGSVQGGLMLVELLLGILVPSIMFLRRRVRESPGGIVTAASLVILGVALNRANVVFGGMAAQAGGATYIPSPVELAVTVGIVAAGLLVYLFVMENFPIVPETPESHAVRAEEEAIKRAREVTPTERPRIAARATHKAA